MYTRNTFNGLYPADDEWCRKGSFVHDSTDDAIAEHQRFTEVPTPEIKAEYDPDDVSMSSRTSARHHDPNGCADLTVESNGFTRVVSIVSGIFDRRKVDNIHDLRFDMDDLTGFQRDLLWAIHGLEEPHGLAVKATIEEYYNTEIHHGRLYPNLDTLVEKGLVEKGQLDKRTNVYTVSKRGRRELEARREWERQFIDEASKTEATN